MVAVFYKVCGLIPKVQLQMGVGDNSPKWNRETQENFAYFKGGKSPLVEGDDKPTDRKSGLGIGGSLQLYCPSKKWESKPSVIKALKLIAIKLFKHQLTWLKPIF